LPGGNPDTNNEAESHASMKGINDVNSLYISSNITGATCGKCHAEETDHFKNTMHFQEIKS